MLIARYDGNILVRLWVQLSISHLHHLCVVPFFNLSCSSIILRVLVLHNFVKITRAANINYSRVFIVPCQNLSIFYPDKLPATDSLLLYCLSQKPFQRGQRCSFINTREPDEWPRSDVDTRLLKRVAFCTTPKLKYNTRAGLVASGFDSMYNFSVIRDHRLIEVFLFGIEFS